MKIILSIPILFLFLILNRMTRMKFFLILMGASFVYYIFPGYLLQILSFFSWVCWVWPRSITAQQIGSSQSGLGLGAFSFDWAGISAYHGSPLVTPWSSILNVGVGFVMFIYIVLPVCYWKFNTFDARKFPIFSNKLFTRTGQKYDTTKVLTPEFELNVAAYNNYGKLYLSPLFALSIGSGFARFTATLTHVALFHGRYALLSHFFFFSCHTFLFLVLGHSNSFKSSHVTPCQINPYLFTHQVVFKHN